MSSHKPRRIRVRLTAWYKKDINKHLYGVQARFKGKWLDVVDSNQQPVLFPTRGEAEKHRVYIRTKLLGGSEDAAQAFRENALKVTNRSLYNVQG